MSRDNLDVSTLASDFKITLEEIKQRVNSINITNNSTPRMTSLTIEPLKYLSKLPEFNGDYNRLQNFIDLVDRIHPFLTTYDELSQLIFIDLIKSKFVGKAREAIDINYHITSWTDLKDLLNHNFGDRKSADQLFEELRSVTFRTNSLDMYNEIKGILRRLNVKTRSENASDSERSRQILTANIKSALDIFKSKLPEPMKSVLYCRAPDSLETAINILHESGYAYYNPYHQTHRPNNSSRYNQNRNRNTDSNIQQPRHNNLNRGRQPPISQTNPPQHNFVNRNLHNAPRLNATYPRNTDRYNFNSQRPYYNRYCNTGDNNNFQNDSSPRNNYNNTRHNNPPNGNNNSVGPRTEPMEVDMIRVNQSEANETRPQNFRSPASTGIFPI